MEVNAELKREKLEVKRAQIQLLKQQQETELKAKKEEKKSAAESKLAKKQETALDRKKHKELKPKFVFPFKKFPFAVLILSIISIIIFCTVNDFRYTNSNKQLMINLHILPIISIQFIYFGLYLRREFKGIFKIIGILLILLTPFVWATTLTVFSDDKRFFVNVVMPFIPINEQGTILSIYNKVFFEKFDIAQALNTIENARGDMQLYLWEFYSLGYSSTLYLGLLAYFILPLIKKLKITKNSNWRYFISIFILPIAVLIFLAVILAVMLMIIFKIFAGDTTSSSSPSYSSSSSGRWQENEPSEYIDNRNYKTQELDGIKRAQLSTDEKSLTDLNTGRSYSIYNYDQRNGYLEDSNGNIYYFDKYAQNTDNLKPTNQHRRAGESEYDAQRRLNN